MTDGDEVTSTTTASILSCHAGELPPCRVCGQKASGFHYGLNTCQGCKSFFKRCLMRSSIRKCKNNQQCNLTSLGRKHICAFCRYQKCVRLGMSKDSIRNGRYTEEKRHCDKEEVKRLAMQAALSEPTEASAPKRPCQQLEELLRSPKSSPLGSPGSVGSVTSNEARFTKLCSSLKPTSVISYTGTISDEDSSDTVIQTDDIQKIQVGPPSGGSPARNNHSPQSTLASPSSTKFDNKVMVSSSIGGSYSMSTSPKLEDNDALEVIVQSGTTEKYSPTQSKISQTSNRVNTTLAPNVIETVPPSALPGSSSMYTSVRQPPLPDGNADCPTSTLHDDVMDDDEDVDITEPIRKLNEIDELIQSIMRVERPAGLHWRAPAHHQSMKEEQELINDKRMKREIFGTMEPLQPHEYKQIYRSTGLDVDGRKAMLTRALPFIRGIVQFLSNFMKRLPGFTNLDVADWTHIVNANYTSFYSLMYYQFFNVELKSFSWFDWGLLYPADIVEKYTNVMIRLKDLELTPEEQYVLVGYAILSTDMELSPHAQSIITECQQQVTAALRLLLSHCHDNDDVMFYRCHSAVVDMQSVSSIMEPERRDMFAVCSMEYPTYEKLKSKEDF